MKILHLDVNHPILIDSLNNLGYTNDEDYISTKKDIIKKIKEYDGIIIRSRFAIDKKFINHAINLKFIARVGSGIENIDLNYAISKNIKIISSPEGNSNAVGEHAMGLLLSLANNINKSSNEVRNGVWQREKNRGFEIENKTISILGLGNTGKSFVKKLSSFNCNVIYFDINNSIETPYARSSTLKEIFENTDILSLHLPLTEKTKNLVNKTFIYKFKKPFFLINTSRGNIVNTTDMLDALNSKQILGAGLDVLDIENVSFMSLDKNVNYSFKKLKNLDNVIITPHIAGWTNESKIKLAETIVEKIVKNFRL
jgi:D-3-phosphoglycerate dehydrogenase